MLILHILVVLTIETAVVICSSDAIKIKCTYIDEFFYATPDLDCTTYYRCLAQGQSVTEECDTGSKFDFFKQTCTRSAGVCFEPICMGKSDGVYQDSTHACRRFYLCQGEKITTLDNCPPNQLHNGKKCVSQELVSCGAPHTNAIGYPIAADQRCIGKADGHHELAGNCTEYMVCLAEAVSAVKSCPKGERFHAEQQNCVLQQVVSNRNDDNKKTAAIDTEHICDKKRDGPNVDPTSVDCATYVICKSGKFVSQRRCNHQAVFNGESCVPSPLYHCPHTRTTNQNAQLKDFCQKKPNGYYASPQHGCSSYMRCMSGRSILINECPAGQFFDAESSNCVFEKFIELRRCFDRGVSIDCDGKANGIYREPNCQSYYHCFAGYKTEYKCSIGRLYNGVACVPKSQYTCPTAGGDTACANRPDGYFKDHNDGCRSYHFCSSGHKITYLCEAGHIFDEKTKKCVRQILSGSSSSVRLRCRSDYLCYGKSEGYHADFRSNCRNYVYCKNYEKITQLTCRDNNVFNGHKCVPTSEYACPSLYNHRQLNCMPKNCLHQCRNDGFFPDLNTDCRDYFFCIGGKMSKLSCPLGRRFNGEICVAEDKFSCPVFCSHSNKESSGSCPLSVLEA